MPSRRIKYFRLSTRWMAEFLSGKPTMVLGLPSDGELVHSRAWQEHLSDSFCIEVSHPSWPEVPEGDLTPYGGPLRLKEVEYAPPAV